MKQIVSKNYCYDCEYFEQHYKKGDRRLIGVACGDCTHPRKLKSNIIACEYWQKRTEKDTVSVAGYTQIAGTISYCQQLLIGIIDYLAIICGDVDIGQK